MLILLFTLLIGLGCSSDDEHLSQETVEAAISSRCMLRRLYDKYKSDHGLIRSQHEHPHRLTLFEKTLKRIQQLKKNSEITWRVGFTPLSDLTDAEIQTQYMGANVTMLEASIDLQMGEVETPPVLQAGTIPEEYDWRNPYNIPQITFVTRVQHQKEGSCWARAAVVPLEALMRKHSGKLIPLSVFEIYDSTYQGENGYDDRGSGGHFVDAWKWLQRNGKLSSRQDIPDRPGAKPTHFMKYAYDDEENVFRGFKIEKIYKAKDVNKLVSSVFLNSPVAIIMWVEGLDLKHYKGDPMYSSACKKGRNHAMAVVGYTKRTLVIKNSWGVEWGDEGYLIWKRMVNMRTQCGLYDNAYYPTISYDRSIIEEKYEDEDADDNGW